MKSVFPTWSSVNEKESKPVAKKINMIEILALLLMFIPFGSLTILMFAPISRKDDYFLFLYRLAIISSFPTAIFALVVELFMIIKGRSLNLLRIIIIGLGAYAFVASVLFWLFASIRYLD
jgi:hypothetical protein